MWLAQSGQGKEDTCGEPKTKSSLRRHWKRRHLNKTSLEENAECQGRVVLCSQNDENLNSGESDSGEANCISIPYVFKRFLFKNVLRFSSAERGVGWEEKRDMQEVWELQCIKFFKRHKCSVRLPGKIKPQAAPFIVRVYFKHYGVGSWAFWRS